MIDDFDTIPCDPSAVLPRQISGGGPRALMLAVLEDAIRCIEEGRRRRHFYTRRLAAEAEAWVRCEQRDWPFSFVIICEVLGFDVDAVRARLLTKVHECRRLRHGVGQSRQRGRAVQLRARRGHEWQWRHLHHRLQSSRPEVRVSVVRSGSGARARSDG